MWEEEVADRTAEHLRSHIGAYLDEIATEKPDGITLIKPKAIETSNLVGGVYSVNLDKLPAYAVDVLDKGYVGQGDNDYLYTYNGHIAVIISAGSESAANRIVKRHARAVEKFVKEHQFLHGLEVRTNEAYFHEYGFGGKAFSGAAETERDPGNSKQQPRWVAGARIDCTWVTRETGFFQHDG